LKTNYDPALYQEYADACQNLGWLHTFKGFSTNPEGQNFPVGADKIPGEKPDPCSFFPEESEERYNCLNQIDAGKSNRRADLAENGLKLNNKGKVVPDNDPEPVSKPRLKPITRTLNPINNDYRGLAEFGGRKTRNQRRRSRRRK
jgi:hypothetical protein